MTTTRENRIKGAVYGQLIGDAATLGTHWIYDTSELLAQFGGDIAGFETPAAGHYHAGKQSGEQTHYGDAAIVLIDSISANDGVFDANTFGAKFHALFGSNSYTGYRDHSTKDTITNIDNFVSKNPNTPIPYKELGSSDDQMASVTALAAVIASSSSNCEALANVESFTRIRQNNAKAVAYSKTLTLILLELLDAQPPSDAIQNALRQLDLSSTFENEAKQRIELALTKLSESNLATTASLGQSCPLEGSLPAAIHSFLKHEGDFRTAILETIKAGGDNAGRAAIIGALAGASQGLDAIPKDWLEKLIAKKKLNAFFKS